MLLNLHMPHHLVSQASLPNSINGSFASLSSSPPFFLSLVLASPPPQTNFKPNKLVLQVHKDSATNLHVANVRTPLLQVPFLVNLEGKFLWVNCDQQYLTSTYHAPYCYSTQCSKDNSHTCHTCPYTARPWCHNNTWAHGIEPGDTSKCHGWTCTRWALNSVNSRV